jgi:hypothetical protein
VTFLRRLASRLPAPLRAALRELLPPLLVRLLGGSVRGGMPVVPAVSAAGGLPQARQEAQSEPGGERSAAAMLLVLELDNAEAVVGELFRRRFATSSFPPDPQHFVGFYRQHDGSLLPVGYIHHQRWEGQSLSGGLVIDERHYRRIPAVDRKVIHAAGGVAEALLRESFALLRDEPLAIWAHVGNKQSEKVCLRVGYRRTEDPYVMVIWRRPDLSEAEKAHWVERVVGYGPF